MRYVDVVCRDVRVFLTKYPRVVLQGFDIGGGTPTSLSIGAFERLLNCFRWVSSHAQLGAGFEPSIEATFSTVSDEKVRMVAQSGIRRMSLGVQSATGKVLELNGRESTALADMKGKIDMMRANGIAKVNLDFMYGLQGQSVLSLQEDIRVIEYLQPEQVTLYELRTNMIAQSSHTTAETRYQMYSFFFKALVAMGYHARFGQNTFSKSAVDMGVSSYLRSRMLLGTPYKGFGVSAQSMGAEGGSYNVGKNASQLTDLLKQDCYGAEYTYRLPSNELASKYVAIASYSGAFRWSRYVQLLNELYSSKQDAALQFCIERDLVQKEGDIIAVTPKGFLHYGAVFSLFWD